MPIHSFVVVTIGQIVWKRFGRICRSDVLVVYAD